MLRQADAGMKVLESKTSPFFFRRDVFWKVAVKVRSLRLWIKSVAHCVKW